MSATRRTAWWLTLALSAAACVTTAPSGPPGGPSKGLSGTGEVPYGSVRDSVWLPLERKAAPPAGYGLYSVLLARSAGDRNAQRVLAELLVTAVRADEAALARENLNLITLPVRNAAEMQREIAPLRAQADAAAALTLQKHYDFGQAALLLKSLCDPARGEAVMRACGGTPMPPGPLLVTTLQPLDGTAAPGQRMLIVNLSTTSPEAVREVLATYRRQILRKDFEVMARGEGWRLAALNHVLDIAQLLPSVSKAYAGTR